MNIIVGENVDRPFIEQVIKIIDEELDGTILATLDDATMYIITGNGDRVSLDVVKHLVQAGLIDRANAFIAAIKRGKTMSSFIPNGTSTIMIIKMDVEGANGWYGVPIEVLVTGIISALEHGGIIEQQPKERVKDVLRAVVNCLVDEKNACLRIEQVPMFYS